MPTSWTSDDPSVHDPDFEDIPEKAPLVQPPTERLAIISLVAGIAGFFFPVVGPVTAIVSGHVARAEIRRSNGRLGGDAFARTGLILGYVWVVLSVVFALAFMAFMVTMVEFDRQRVTQPLTIPPILEPVEFVPGHSPHHGGRPIIPSDEAIPVPFDPDVVPGDSPSASSAPSWRFLRVRDDRGAGEHSLPGSGEIGSMAAPSAIAPVAVLLRLVEEG